MYSVELALTYDLLGVCHRVVCRVVSGVCARNLEKSRCLRHFLANTLNTPYPTIFHSVAEKQVVKRTLLQF